MSDAGQKSLDVGWVLAGGGEMGALMRAFDWSKTPLGAVESWPRSLQNAVSVMLPSKAQICLFYGSQYTFLYNDAYSPTLAEKHPHALGIPGWDVWGEVWDVLMALFEKVLSTGDSIAEEDYPFLLNRRGFVEETYYDISYDPLLDEKGAVGGILCIVSESTGRVLGARWLSILRELGTRISDAKTPEEACIITADILADHPKDVPFALAYLLDKQGEKAILTGCMGVEDGQAINPPEIDLAADDIWPLKAVCASGESLRLTDLQARFDTVPPGVWPNAPETALVLPLLSAGKCIGFFIAGVSPRLLLDEQYEGFFGLVAGHLEKAIEFARAYEVERERAEALAELDRAKTVFFNNISHEFRTPLTLILDPLTTLLDSAGLNDDQRETIRLVQRNGQRLLKLVNTLLDFSRIEAGRADVNFEPTDLAAYTTDLASMFRAAVDGAGLSLVVNCPPLPEPIYVDREMWEKVVLNLLSNAFKFTFEGRIEVELTCFDDHVELAVCDTGVGIPAEELPLIFDRFHRVRGTHSRTQEGTGIGLSLVQDIVTLHKGSLTVESTLGKGTTFRVSIPRGTAHLPPDRIEAERRLTSTSVSAMTYVEEALRWLPDAPKILPAEVEAAIQPEGVDLPRVVPVLAQARIVLADDNADMREYLTRLLAAHYTVEAYADGQQALDAIRAHRPDLVLSDVMMPGLDGFELLRALRNDFATQSLPVILLSARAGEESTVEGLEAGADDYLVKPFSARELLARVGAQLEMARLREEIVSGEQALRMQAEAERQHVTSILESISESFVTLDRGYRFTYLNPQADDLLEKLSGKTRSELLGNTVWDMFPGSKESVFGEAYQRAMQGRISLQVEDYYEPLDVWLSVHVHPTDEGLAIYFEDVTERKNREAAMKRQTTELAVLEERQRIARDLHDSVNQLLFSASVLTDALPMMWERNPDKMLNSLATLRQLTQGAMAEMRALLMELRPASQEHARLGDMLTNLVERVRGSTALDITLSVEDDDTAVLPLDIRLALYRIAQEALNNVVKHANTHKAAVSLRRAAGFAEIHIRDEGDGFTLGTASSGIGLHSMAERAEKIGAALEVKSQPGQGTDVSVTWKGSSSPTE